MGGHLPASPLFVFFLFSCWREKTEGFREADLLGLKWLPPRGPVPVGTGSSLAPRQSASLCRFSVFLAVCAWSSGSRSGSWAEVLHGSSGWTSQSQLALPGALLGSVLPDFGLGLAVSEPLFCARSEKSHVTSLTTWLAPLCLFFEAQPSRETGVKAVRSPQKEWCVPKLFFFFILPKNSRNQCSEVTWLRTVAL